MLKTLICAFLTICSIIYIFDNLLIGTCLALFFGTLTYLFMKHYDRQKSSVTHHSYNTDDDADLPKQSDKLSDKEISEKDDRENSEPWKGV